MRKYLKSRYSPAMLGAAIEYYDLSLYGYMAPIMVAMFFPQFPKTTAYLYYFAFEILAGLIQLLGGGIFGKIGDKYGRKNVMYYCIIGTCVATFIVTILPTYEQIGAVATLMFLGTRIMQRFFVGGEYTGGAIYCIEHEKDQSKHGTISGIYAATTFVGILSAGVMASLVNYLGSEYFRLAYGFSLLLCILTIYMRRKMRETPEYIAVHNNANIAKPINKSDRFGFLQNVILSTLCSIIYGIPSRIANALIPLQNKIDTTTIMHINNLALAIYLIACLLFGVLADKIGIIRLLRYVVLTLMITVLPTFWLLQSASVWHVLLAKIWFALVGAGMSSILSAWAVHLFAVHNRYFLLSTSYAISRLLSTIFMPISIGLFEYDQTLSLVAIMVMCVAILAYYLLRHPIYDTKGN